MADPRTNHFPFEDVNGIAQHPDTETYYNGVHQKAGAECADRHMPRVLDARTGKTWTEQQAVYAIDSMKNKTMGKLRKAEFWLTRFVDKFEEAQNLGVDKAVLDDARGRHHEAHVQRAFRTAGNGSYFRNPDLAMDSINKGMGISRAGIQLLGDAMAAR